MSAQRLTISRLLAVAGLLTVAWTVPQQAEPVAAGGPLFAVIPTLGVGGPLAILAILFPSLFGGVLLLFRQWGAFFLVVSINSLLFCLHPWLAPALVDSWWGTQTALWLTMTFITLAGLLWGWRRNIHYLKSASPQAVAPVRTEHLVLWLLSLICAGIFLYFVLAGLAWDSLWVLLLILAAGLWAGTAYKLVRAIAGRKSTGSELPTEAVMLGVMLAGCILFVAGRGGLRGDTTEIIAAEGQPVAKRDTGEKTVIPLKRIDNYYSDREPFHYGAVLSSPCVAGDHVFAALADTDPSNPMGGRGALFCIDRRSNEVVWTFNDDSKMQPVFSSPCVADGRVYIGEGFHYNPDCKLYCLDAQTGKKLWDFATTSQVESTPCVAGGKVFFGAGNDGLYALNAETGAKLWQYRQETPIFRVGAGPIAVNGKVYFGSGVDRDDPDSCESALVCLDAESGKEIWKVKVDLPCWSAPEVAGDVVYFTLGNGDVLQDDFYKAGAVLCLDARTGKQLWRFDVPNGVHNRPALDSKSVFFGSRDGFCYCLNRFNGEPRWKKDLGSPIFGGAVLDQGAQTGRAVNVFVIATDGRISCLDAQTGQAHWSWHDLEQKNFYLASTPALVNFPTPEGTRRQIYFGVWAKVNPITNEAYLYCLEDILGVP